MNLRSLDLNLLVVFDAIYQERNVTRAAEKVFLSQPATSNALARLRTHLKDELFLRGPDGLRATPRAKELAPRVHAILTELKDVLEPQAFDPATARRSLKIASADYFSVVVAPTLLGILRREAPGIRVHILSSVKQIFEDLDSGEIDFAASAVFDAMPERFGRTRLIEDSYSCLVRKGHPFIGVSDCLREYARQSHLLVSPRGDARGFVDDELAKSGLTRNVSLVLAVFAAAPPIVARSDLILTAPTRVLQQLKTPEHVLLECPVDVPLEYRCMDLIWHERLSRHPASDWLRCAVLRAVEEATGQQGLTDCGSTPELTGARGAGLQ